MISLRREEDITGIAHSGLIFVSIRELRPVIQKYHVDRRELIGPGWLGLHHAEKQFDPDFGTKFSTFAIPRIKGSMLDELRTRDCMSRHMRSRVSYLLRMEERLTKMLMRPPSQAELQKALGYGRTLFDEVRACAYPHQQNLEDETPHSVPNFVGIVEAHNTFCELTKRLKNQTMLTRHVFNLRFADSLSRTAVAKKLRVTEWVIREAEQRILAIASSLA